MATYNRAHMRNWLTDFFEDEDDLGYFADDNFPDVYAQFTDDTDTKKKAHLITKYCETNNAFDQLISLLEQDYPDRFSAFPPPTPTESDTAPTTKAQKPDSSSSSLGITMDLSDLPDSPPNTTSNSDSESVKARAGATTSSASVANSSGGSKDVFISYAQDANAFVDELYQNIEGSGLNAWLDKKQLSGGERQLQAIAEGIRDCKVFVPVLSPGMDSSDKVTDETDLARRYEKQILPVLWQTAEIPIAMELALAGRKHIDFEKNASTQSYSDLNSILIGLVANENLDDILQDKATVQEAIVPAIEAEPEPTSGRSGGLRRSGGLKSRKSKNANPIALGGEVISSVVTTFDLDREDKLWVNGQLKWLFEASDHTLKINDGQTSEDMPVPGEIPESAEKLSAYNNGRLTNINHAIGQSRTIREYLDLIERDLRVLSPLVTEAANLGGAKTDTALQYKIRSSRISIVDRMRHIAGGMELAYGVRLTAPDDLKDFLEQER